MNRQRSKTTWQLAMGVVIPWMLFSAPAQTESVGVIVDVQGTVTLNRNAAVSAADILDDLELGDMLDVAEDSVLVLVYFASGTEYEIPGPEQAIIGRGEARLATGVVAGTRQLALARDMEKPPFEGPDQAVVPGEDIRLLEPRGGILETRPVFRWGAVEESSDYRFVLEDRDGTVLMDVPVTGTEQRLTPDMELEAGGSYRWRVEARSPDGAMITGLGEFHLPSREDRELITGLRPDANGPVSEIVLYAFLLEQHGLLQAAQEQWALVARRRPDARSVKDRAQGCRGAVCF